jgi:FMN reductase
MPSTDPATPSINLTPSPHIVGLGGTLRDGSTSRQALEQALGAAADAGATTELIDLHTLRLPLYEPGRALDAYDASVQRLVEAYRRADGMLWSTAAYHGTLTGAMKNAIDFFQFVADADYLDGRPVGLIATAGGTQAAPGAINALIHAVHALRGNVIPLQVAVPSAYRVFGDGAASTGTDWTARLDTLGRLTTEAAQQQLPAQQPAPEPEPETALAA